MSGRCNCSMQKDFPVDIHRSEHRTVGTVIEYHWHENFEILYFEQGEAIVYCNSRPIKVGPGELIIINSNDVHSCENISPQLVYYVVEFNPAFIQSSQLDLCQTKYLTPLIQNRLLFRHQIDHDSELIEEIRQLISEYYRQDLGYELAVKAYIYRILVLLLRYYGEQTMSKTEKDRQRRTLAHLTPVLDYIDCHYMQKLSLGQLAAIANMSPHHFCRLFKSLTGKTTTEYINHLRLSKAAVLLQESNLNITEVAFSVGFNDSNYFSRQFKKHKLVAPSKLLK